MMMADIISSYSVVQYFIASITGGYQLEFANDTFVSSLPALRFTIDDDGSWRDLRYVLTLFWRESMSDVPVL